MKPAFPEYLLLPIVAGMLVLSISGRPVAAQTEAVTASAVCMKMQGSSGENLSIVVDRESETDMAARGYGKVACPGSAANLAEYRQRACRFAERTPATVQREFIRSFGVSPAELCTMADKVLGPERARE